MGIANRSISLNHQFFYKVFYENADLRIRDYPFMGNPLPIVSVYIFYVIFIVFILKYFMRDREPFNVDKFSAALNFILFLNASYFFLSSLRIWINYYNWWCEPVTQSTDAFSLEVSHDLKKLLKN